MERQGPAGAGDGNGDWEAAILNDQQCKDWRTERGRGDGRGAGATVDESADDMAAREWRWERMRGHSRGRVPGVHNSEKITSAKAAPGQVDNMGKGWEAVAVVSTILFIVAASIAGVSSG